MAADRKSKNSKATPYGTRPVGRPRKESTRENEEQNIIEEEEQDDTLEINNDHEMDNAGPSRTLIEELNKKIIRKKKGKIALPVLATMAEPYDILEDLAHQKANITVAQLIQTSPSQRTQLSKGMRRATALKPKRKRRVMLGQKLKTTSAWCEAKVGKNIIDLIIDTGASGCVATYSFIKDMGLKIQRSSNISMSDINGVSKQPLGAIDDLLLNIDGIVIPTEVDITEAKTYSVIVGMDFLNKIKANIDIRKGLLTFEFNDRKEKVPIKFIHGDRGNPIFEESSSEEDESEEEDSEKEYEEQHLEKKTFLMWQHDDWNTVIPRQQETQNTHGIKIEETWTPVDNHARDIKYVNSGDMPTRILRSAKIIDDVQTYQEGIKVQWRKFTWDDFKRLDKKFQQECRWNTR